MTVYLCYVGKPRDSRLNALAAEYVKRTSRYTRCEMRQINPARYDPFARHAGARAVVLDAGGRVMDSARFTALVARAEREACDLLFLVGGADGLPAGWRDRADVALSLSALTLPHELARVVLAEQIYRAFATLRGHPYPR
jgi:23S rRNA (pseudouridine1915-N3)-methyltransferase